jgi:hypothetical protein
MKKHEARQLAQRARDAGFTAVARPDSHHPTYHVLVYVEGEGSHALTSAKLVNAFIDERKP